MTITQTFQNPSPQATREMFAQYPSGVAALAAVVEGVPQVLIASSFTVGVSLEPPLVMFAVQNTSNTWPLLRQADRIGISFMAYDQRDLCRQLASRDVAKRFEHVSYRQIGSEILIDGAAGSLSCSLYGEHLAGDHHIIVLRVEGIEPGAGVEPLVFHSSKFTRMITGTNIDC